MVVLGMVILPFVRDEYSAVLMTDIVIAALFAASLQFLLATGGMTSFGHAAYFGVGAYAAALAVRAGLPMLAAVAIAPLAAGVAAVVFGWFCVRLAGVYMAMLTLAFAQIVWSIAFQWESVTAARMESSASGRPPGSPAAPAFYYFALTVVAIAAFVLIRVSHSPFGLALRGVRDSPLRAAALGINVVGGALARICAGRRIRRNCRRPVCVLQGQHFPGIAGDPALRRRHRDGSVGRPQRAVRAAARRRCFHLARGFPGARHRVLACAARSADPGHRAGISDRHRWRRALAPATGGRAMSCHAAQGFRSRQGVRRRARGRWRDVFPSRKASWSR
jgi:hypothetical protein